MDTKRELFQKASIGFSVFCVFVIWPFSGVWAQICNPTESQQIETLNQEALAKLTKGEFFLGWRKAQEVMVKAKAFGCENHKALALTNLLMGYVAFQEEEWGRGKGFIERCLDLAPNLQYPKKLGGNYTRNIFSIMQKRRVHNKNPQKKGVCDKNAVERLQLVLEEVHSDLVVERFFAVIQKSKKAIAFAKKQRCQKHVITARIYLLMGISEYRIGARKFRLTGWMRALRIDPNLLVPRDLQTASLLAHFRQVRHFIKTRQWRDVQADESSLDEKDKCQEDEDCKESEICRNERCVDHKSSKLSLRATRDSEKEIKKSRKERGKHSSGNPKKKKRFSDKKSYEVGFGVAFRNSSDKYTLRSIDYKVEETWYTGSLYLGYFLTKSFVWGVQLSSGVRANKGTGSTKRTVYDVCFSFVPGLAIPTTEITTVYIDALLGFGYAASSKSDEDSKAYALVLGGEAGIKIVLGSNVLMRIGLRPNYWLGKIKFSNSEVDLSSMRVDAIVGISFWK